MSPFTTEPVDFDWYINSAAIADVEKMSTTMAATAAVYRIRAAAPIRA
jgi:hypothetical protein